MLRTRLLTTPGIFGAFRPLSTCAPRLAASSTSSGGLASKHKPTSSVLSALSATASQFKTYKPVTPGLRHLRRPLSPHLYEGRPVRLLTIAQRKKGGRNHTGRITVRHRGGGHKRRLRNIDFTRAEPGAQDVIRIEYDPGRSAHIALIKHRNPNAKQPLSYILACDGLRAGDVVESYRQGIPDGLVPGFTDPLWMGRRKTLPKADTVLQAPDTLSSSSSPSAPSPSEPLIEFDESGFFPISDPTDPSAPQSVSPPELSNAPTSNAPPGESTTDQASLSLSLGVLRALTIKPGNVLPLRLIPAGTQIHNITLRPDGRGQLVRSAGSFGIVVAHDEIGKYTQVKLQSGEVRNLLQRCCATVGKVSNSDWQNQSLGKAGRARWLGRRPSVRGVAMNAVDHPHGGGRGKSKGNKHPRSVWGWLTKGKRTRRPGPKGNTMVVRERPRGKEKRAGGRN